MRHSANRCGAGFETHTQHDHRMWNYIYYLVYLDNKESTEYTGVEDYVADKVSKRINSWFPSGMALCLPEDEAEADSEASAAELKMLAASQECVMHAQCKLEGRMATLESQLETVIGLLSKEHPPGA